jgi:hypothetical protein
MLVTIKHKQNKFVFLKNFIKTVNSKYSSYSNDQGNFDNFIHNFDQLYTEKFQKQLKKILGNPDEFRKANASTKSSIQENMDSLFFLENLYQDCLQKNFQKNEFLLTNLKTKYLKFEEHYNRALRTTSNNKNKKFFHTRLSEYFTFFLNSFFIQEHLFNKEERDHALKMDLDMSSIAWYLNCQEIFQLLCIGSVKIAYKNLFFNNEKLSEIVIGNFKQLESPESKPLNFKAIDEIKSHLKITRSQLKQTFMCKIKYLFLDVFIGELEKMLLKSRVAKRNELYNEIKEIIARYRTIITKKVNAGEPIESIKKGHLFVDLNEELDEVMLESSKYILASDYRLTKLNKVIVYVKKQKFFYETFKEYEMFESACESILDIFIATVTTKTYNVTYKINGRITTETVLVLPIEFNFIHSFSDHLPRIIEPEDWDYNGYIGNKQLTKVIPQGSSEQIFAKKTIDAINIIQKKKFIINQNFFKVLNQINTSTDIKTFYLNLPFPTLAEVYAQKQKLAAIEKNFKFAPWQQKLKKKILNYQTFHSNRFKTLSDRSKVWRLIFSHMDLKAKLRQKTYIIEAEKYATMISKKQIFNTMIQCGKIFSGFPLYFRTYIDYTGRLYQGLDLFNHTIGFYKYLITDYKKIKITVEGFICLLEVYFQNDKLIVSRLNSLHNQTLENLYAFFIKENIVYKKPRDNCLYFFLLEEEISCLPYSGYETRVTIEIDQKCFYGVFSSLILRNKKLASYFNLLGEKKRDLYTYLQNCVKGFITKKMKEEQEVQKNIMEEEKKDVKKVQKGDSLKWNQISDTVEEMLSKDKKMHNLFFMTFFNYSQSSINIKIVNSFIEIVKSLNYNITHLEEKSFIKFAYNYLDFLDYCFPDIAKQYTAYVKCIEQFSKSSYTTIIKSLDGTLFSWTFYLEKKYTGKRDNPMKNKNATYMKTKPFNVTSIEETYKKYIKLENDLSREIALEQDNVKKDKLIRNFAKVQSEKKAFDKSVKKLRKKKQKFFKSGFINCLDGAVRRILIHQMYQNHNYLINYIDDSIQVHPNYVNKFYEEIKQLYVLIDKTDLFNLFYESSIQFFSDPYRVEFNKVISKFNRLKHCFRVNPNSFEPRHLYLYKG